MTAPMIDVPATPPEQRPSYSRAALQLMGFGANSGRLTAVARKLRAMHAPYYPSGKCRADYECRWGLIGDAPVLGMTAEGEPKAQRVQAPPRPLPPTPRPAPGPSAPGPDWDACYHLLARQMLLVRGENERLRFRLARAGQPVEPDPIVASLDAQLRQLVPA